MSSDSSSASSSTVSTPNSSVPPSRPASPHAMETSSPAPPSEASHWTQTRPSNKNRHPIISIFNAKLALSSLFTEDEDDRIDAIANALACFDFCTEDFAEPERNQRRSRAREILSEYNLSPSQMEQTEATRNLWKSSCFEEDRAKTQKRKDEMWSIANYTEELIKGLKSTANASEAAQSLLHAQLDLGGLSIYPVTKDVMRQQLFDSVRKSGALGDGSSEETVKFQFEKQRLNRWQMGLDNDVEWID